MIQKPFFTRSRLILLSSMLLLSVWAQEDADTRITALSKDPEIVKKGSKLFMTTCVLCHTPLIPLGAPQDLKDGKWLHGSKPTEIQTTIMKGVPEKGMPTFGPTLQPEQIESLVAYILSIQPPPTP